MDFLAFLRALSDSGAEFIIVGGVAARLYGSTRLTHDIDVVPRLDPATWPKLVDRIWELGGRPRIPEPLDAVRDLACIERWRKEKGMLALSFRAPDGSAEVDLLVDATDRFAELRANARPVELEGRQYLVAGIDDLIAMKRRAGRPQDQLDVQELERLRDRMGDSG